MNLIARYNPTPDLSDITSRVIRIFHGLYREPAPIYSFGNDMLHPNMRRKRYAAVGIALLMDEVVTSALERLDNDMKIIDEIALTCYDDVYVLKQCKLLAFGVVEEDQCILAHIRCDDLLMNGVKQYEFNS